jgi:hypothetical protein
VDGDGLDLVGDEPAEGESLQQLGCAALEPQGLDRRPEVVLDDFRDACDESRQHRCDFPKLTVAEILGAGGEASRAGLFSSIPVKRVGGNCRREELLGIVRREG